MPMLVRAGSIRTVATSPAASSRSSVARSLNSATRVVCRGSTGAPTLPAQGLAPRPGDDEGLVHAAVIAVAEHQDLRPAGELPREPDGPPVGVGRGEREAPARRSEAPGKVGGHPAGVLGRQ